MRGSKTEYDKFKDADASYQDRESYKIVVEPMSSVYVHECPPESPALRKIGTSWLTKGKHASAIHFGREIAKDPLVNADCGANFKCKIRGVQGC